MRHHNRINWLFLFLAITIGSFFSFNDSSADADYYYRLYERIGNSDRFFVESGYVFLCTIFKNLGFSFYQFKVVLGFLIIVLIGSTILKYSKYPSLVLLCYFCYPFLLDCAQIRHMIACSIFIYSIRYLEIYNLRNLISYIICIILAATVQMIAWAFLCFLPIYIIRNKRILYSVCLFGTIILFLSISIVINLPIVRFLLETRSKEGVYDSGVPLGQLIFYLAFFLSLVFVAVRKNLNNAEDNAYFLQRFSIMSLIFLPILLVDFQFTRLFRACLIPIYISCWNNIAGMKPDKRFIVGTLFLFVFALVFYKLFITSRTYYESLTYPIIFDNLLIR